MKPNVARRRLGVWGFVLPVLDRSVTGKAGPMKSSSYRKSGYVYHIISYHIISYLQKMIEKIGKLRYSRD